MITEKGSKEKYSSKKAEMKHEKSESKAEAKKEMKMERGMEFCKMGKKKWSRLSRSIKALATLQSSCLNELELRMPSRWLLSR